MTRAKPRARAAEDRPEREALAWLARRPLSERELRERLAAAGHAPATVARTCRGLREAGYLDDRKLAEHYILTRAQRLGRGPVRLIAELVRRGVPRQVAARAWDDLAERGDVSAEELLARQLERRLGRRCCLDPREHARQAQALLRAGFAPALVRRALAPLRRSGGAGAEP